MAGIARGSVFRKVDRWGNLADDGINSSSLIPMLRRIFKQAGIPADIYSSHAMRRGFATWASSNGWDIKSLMSYVGWKDVKSTLRYVDAGASFVGLAVRAPTSELERL